MAQALTGFLAGMNEQREAEQQLENSRVLNEYRASEALKNLEQIKRDNAWKSGLAAIMTESPNAAEGPAIGLPPVEPKPTVQNVPVHPAEGARSEEVTTPVPPSVMADYVQQQQAYQQRVQAQTQLQRTREVQQADKLDRAAAWTMQFDPQRAVGMANLASNIRSRHSHMDAEQERVRGLQQQQEAARRDTQASALGAIDSQENYPAGYRTYLQRGGQPIPGLTGDWLTDKPLIEYHASAGLKAADQNRNEVARANAARQAAESEAKAERAKAAAERAVEEAARKERETAVHEAEAKSRAEKREKEAAAAQARINQASAVNDKDKEKARDQFDTIVGGMETPPTFDTAARKDISERAAIRAKKRIVDGDKRDFADLVDEEIRGEIVLWKRRGMWAMPDFIPGVGGKEITGIPSWVPKYGTPPPAHLINPHAATVEQELRSGTQAPSRPQTRVSNTPGGAATGTAGPTRAMARALEYYHVNKATQPRLREFFKEEYGYYPD